MTKVLDFLLPLLVFFQVVAGDGSSHLPIILAQNSLILILVSGCPR